MDKRTTGIYHKFNVQRTDGSDKPGGKHHDCRYFVLDLDHDKFAKPAIAAYADACEEEYPVLAADCRAGAGEHASVIATLRAELTEARERLATAEDEYHADIERCLARCRALLGKRDVHGVMDGVEQLAMRLEKAEAQLAAVHEDCRDDLKVKDRLPKSQAVLDPDSPPLPPLPGQVG